MMKRLRPGRGPIGLVTPPRRRPPPELLPLPGVWPDNATSAERFDPLWQQLLRDGGAEAVRQRIDALRADDDDKT